MSYTDLWPLIQKDILGMLLADPFIGTRPGVCIEPGETQNSIDKKITKNFGIGSDGKKGIGFLVLPIEEAEDENENIPGGPLKLKLSIQFCENVLENNALSGTQIPLRIWTARAAKILKLYTPVNLCSPLVGAKPFIYEFTDDLNKGMRVGSVEFSCREADCNVMQRLMRPQLSQAGSGYPYTVTVTQAAASSLYYTIDGSHPWQGNPTAVLYSAPINIAAACLLRVRAFGTTADDSQLASDTASLNFT